MAKGDSNPSYQRETQAKEKIYATDQLLRYLRVQHGIKNPLVPQKFLWQPVGHQSNTKLK